MKKFLKAVIVIVIFSSVLLFLHKFQQRGEMYEINSWNNIYNEDSIRLFYEEEEDKRLEILRTTYKIDEIINDEDGEINKALRITDIVNSIVEYDDVSDEAAFNGYDILRLKGESKKASGRDMAIIMRDLLTSVGYTARIGEFRSEESINSNEKRYYVVEYWSNENEKWIMIDFLDRGYFKSTESLCSAIEIVSEKIGDLEYIGKKTQKDYLKEKKYLFNSYTIMIDNSLDMSTSNSYLTFIKNDNNIKIKYDGTYNPPTIYTEKIELFNKVPGENIIIKDENAYIILMKKEGDNESFIIGGFKNGKIIEKYFISKNNSGYEEVFKYDEVKLTSGINNISLSIDGENESANIEIKYNTKNVEKN